VPDLLLSDPCRQQHSAKACLPHLQSQVPQCLPLQVVQHFEQEPVPPLPKSLVHLDQDRDRDHTVVWLMNVWFIKCGPAITAFGSAVACRSPGKSLDSILHIPIPLKEAPKVNFSSASHDQVCTLLRMNPIRLIAVWSSGYSLELEVGQRRGLGRDRGNTRRPGRARIRPIGTTRWRPC
jgi:hypothetical protein